jgi:hypothetical protein
MRLKNFWKKKAIIELSMLAILLFVLVLLLVLLPFAGKFNKFVNKEVTDDECRLSLIANAKIRFPNPDLSAVVGQGKNEERIPINCKRLDDLNIEYSDLKSTTKAGREYQIMKNVAEEMVNCHYRYVGDVKEVAPFANNEGVYCGICRKISFDEKIQKDEDLSVVDDLFTYLINSRMQTGNRYYSDYLYGYDKGTEANVEYSSVVKNYLTSNYKSDEIDKLKNNGFEAGSLNLNTSKEYYVMHAVFKGENTIKKIFGRNLGKVSATTSFCGALAVSLVPLFLNPEPVVTKIVGAVGGIALLGCVGSGAYTIASLDEEMAVAKSTFIVEVDGLDPNLCDETYGIEKQEIKN